MEKRIFEKEFLNAMAFLSQMTQREIQKCIDVGFDALVASLETFINRVAVTKFFKEATWSNRSNQSLIGIADLTIPNPSLINSFKLAYVRQVPRECDDMVEHDLALKTLLDLTGNNAKVQKILIDLAGDMIILALERHLNRSLDILFKSKKLSWATESDIRNWEVAVDGRYARDMHFVISLTVEMKDQ